MIMDVLWKRDKRRMKLGWASGMNWQRDHWAKTHQAALIHLKVGKDADEKY